MTARRTTCNVLPPAASLALLVTTACLSHDDRGHPLFPATDPPPAREHVARLVGAIDFVDGQKVPSSTDTFELLPGCHVVVTPRSWGHSAGSYAALAVPTGRASFAIPMRAGHQYVVDVEVTDPEDPQGSVRFVAVERGPDGSTVRRIPPAENEQQVQDCLLDGASAEAVERPTSGAPRR